MAICVVALVTFAAAKVLIILRISKSVRAFSAHFAHFWPFCLVLWLFFGYLCMPCVRCALWPHIVSRWLIFVRFPGLFCVFCVVVPSGVLSCLTCLLVGCGGSLCMVVVFCCSGGSG